MSTRCSSSTCINGNCQGCKNGVKYCNDPRCYPNCPDCSAETSVKCVSRRDGWDWWLIIIITVLSIIALILIGLMAWGWYNPDKTVTNDYMEMEYPDEYQRVYEPPMNYAVPMADVEGYAPPNAPRADREGYAPPNDMLADFEGYAPPNVPAAPRVPMTPPGLRPAYNRELDASLNVPVGGMAPPNVLPEVPPVNLTGSPSVASARPPAVPVRPSSVSDGVIRGFV